MKEFNPNNDQKLRLYIMEQFSSEDWQPAYDFLKAGENADNSPQVINFDESSMPDGVYVCYKDSCITPRKEHMASSSVRQALKPVRCAPLPKKNRGRSLISLTDTPYGDVITAYSL